MFRMGQVDISQEPGGGPLVAVSGLVVMRERPAGQRGTMVLTLEDDTGSVRVIVGPDVMGRQRQVIAGARFLRVTGHVGTVAGRILIVATELEDTSWVLETLP